MLDINYIREHAGEVDSAARNKNVAIDINALLALDTTRRSLQGKLDLLRQQRNQAAKRWQRPDETEVAASRELKEQRQQLETEFAAADDEFQRMMESVPNMPSADTPVGTDPSANRVLRQVGTLPTFTFTPKPHWELGETLNVINSKQAGQVVGSRFVYLQGALVQLQFALISYVLSIVTSSEQLTSIANSAELDVVPKPFIPVVPPVFIRPDIMQKMARLEPTEERYYIPTDDLYLVGSAEHTLGPLHMDSTIAATELPIRYVGYSTSFRREAGSHGKDVRGILRLHQFDKIEFESFTTPDNSLNEQNFFVAIQEHLLQSLGLPYQVILKCTGDQGTPDARAIDIETWMAGQNAYRETHTADLMTDYQSRRLKTKVRLPDGTSVFAHMNDATALAIGRIIIAIMENNQQADGSIRIPEILHSYLPFTSITA